MPSAICPTVHPTANMKRRNPTLKYKAFFAALLAAGLLISLAACTGTATVEVTPSAQTEAPAAPADPQPAPAAQQPQEPQKDETAWTLDPAGLTDAYIAETIIRLPELALSSEAFTFDAPVASIGSTRINVFPSSDGVAIYSMWMSNESFSLYFRYADTNALSA